MKAIISHDVDHITVWEHNRDLIIPKFVVRNIIELFYGTISCEEFALRFKDILRNKWQNIEELMAFDKSLGVESTFFVGVANGMGLRYSIELAEFWTHTILANGFDVGVHGIAYKDPELIKSEFDTFKELSGLKNFGIRMHYLRADQHTLILLNKAGYLFDSSLYCLRDPFRIGNMWEFPLHLMDGNVFYKNGHWQDITFKRAKDRTKRIIEKVNKENLEYFSLLFHDRYFSDSFRQWKEWYIWVVSYLKDNGVEFVNYRKAVEQLNRNS